MKAKSGLISKLKDTWKDKEKRKHLLIVTGIVLALAVVITVARDKKTTVNDIVIQYTDKIVEQYETETVPDEETAAPEVQEAAPEAEETSEQIFFLEETTAPEEAAEE